MILRLLGFMAAAAVAAPAVALEVGALQLHRPVGQQPYAEITVTDDVPIDPSALRARIATPEGYRVAGMRYLPVLSAITITPQVASDGRVVLRLDGLPDRNAVAELDLLLLVGDRISLSLNEYRVDLRGTTREFTRTAPGTRLAGLPPAPASASRPAAAVSVAATPAGSDTLGTVDAATTKQIEQTLAAWAQAWSQRATETYLGFYVNDYQPPNRRMSHAEWEKQRRQRIGAKRVIEVTASGIQLSRRGETIVATFQQRYRGDSLVENSRKRMTFAETGGRWLVQEESELSREPDGR